MLFLTWRELDEKHPSESPVGNVSRQQGMKVEVKVLQNQVSKSLLNFLSARLEKEH